MDLVVQDAEPVVAGHRLHFFWASDGPNPPPVRRARSAGRDRAESVLPAVYQAALYRLDDIAREPFDFSARMRRLCADIVSRVEVFHHIDVRRLAFTVTQARSARKLGLQAKVTPMRFAGGSLIRRRRGRTYQVQRYWIDGVEMLYLVSFCLPRFQNQSFDDKLTTVFHELYHIAPEFNGDLRRHGGRYCIHTRSQKGYDAHMTGLARHYLEMGADPSLHAFLRLNFRQLEERYGEIRGLMLPTPKLVPVVAMG